MPAHIVEVTARIDDRPERRFVGRFAWTLAELVKAGDKGITSFENPAPRLSHYVHRLRRDGVAIETVEEKHSGPYSGTLGRYRLTVPVVIVSEVRA
jgi:hypothetical protein